MFHVKRMTAAALAALMIAGAVPALADNYTADDAGESAVTQEETVTERAGKAHKKRSSADADADTGDTSATRKKPAKKSADSGDTSEADADAKTGKPSRKPAKKPGDAQAADNAASDDSAETPTTEQRVKRAKPSKKPARKPEKKSASDTATSADTASETV